MDLNIEYMHWKLYMMHNQQCIFYIENWLDLEMFLLGIDYCMFQQKSNKKMKRISHILSPYINSSY